jgi:hypothetical protein
VTPSRRGEVETSAVLDLKMANTRPPYSVLPTATAQMIGGFCASRKLAFNYTAVFVVYVTTLSVDAIELRWLNY